MRLPLTRARLLAGLLIAVVPNGEPAAGSDGTPLASLDPDAAHSGTFRKVVQVADDPRRWVYEGAYRYSPEEGLVWTIEAPVRGSLRIDRDGEARTEGDLGGMEIITRRTVARLIHAMVAMDREVLGRYYHIEETRDHRGFEIVLAARENWVRQAGTVTIHGRDNVESVHIAFADGRVVTIEFGTD